MLRVGATALARRGAASGSSASSCIQSTLFRRNALGACVAPQRSGPSAPWFPRPNLGFLQRKQVEPGWTPPPAGRKQPQYESPYGSNYIDDSFNVPENIDLYWEDGIQREWIVDKISPHVSRGEALRALLAAFLVVAIMVVALANMYPHADLAVPPVLPKEILENYFQLVPENKDWYEQHLERMKRRTARVELAAANDTAITPYRFYESMVVPMAAGIWNKCVRVYNSAFGSSSSE